MRSTFLFTLFYFTTSLLASQALRVEPPSWWTGMVNPELELLVYAENISATSPTIIYEGVKIKEVIKPENPNYLFIKIHLNQDVKPGTFDIVFSQGKKVRHKYAYNLQQRVQGSAQRAGVDNSDVIYLITPDRFANGDESNDKTADMLEGINRSEPFGRHGGDILGIHQQLDYLSGMGFTGIWLNPILENNMERASYHGYSTTDFYRVDPRFGTNEEYAAFSEDMKSRGLKLIMDMIVNHCGSNHWFVKDPPGSDWINFDNTFVQTNHMKPVIQDPYASEYDYKRMVDGWFVRTMPDLNQRNPHMARYLIQNSIWWVEYAGLAGIRMDTWPYSDKHFLRDWSCAIMSEYPNLLITGEEWSNNPLILAYWQKGANNKDGYETCLPSLLDFPLQDGLKKGLTNDQHDWSGLISMYEALANDHIYADPSAFVIFPDNHDMDRIYTQMGKDLSRFKNAMAYILTMRGTPQLYYGTEVLLANDEPGNHGDIREDFPGGWSGDAINAFTGTGLNDDQKTAMEFIRRINTWRKGSEAIRKGDVLHFVPFNNIYVYFRRHGDEKVMTVINRNAIDATIDISRLKEVLGNATAGTDILTGSSVSLNGTLNVTAGEPMIIEIR